MSTNLVQILDEAPSKLPSTKLPTIGDVLKAIYFEQERTKEAAIKTVAKQIEVLWQNSTIPTISSQRIVAKLTELFETHYKLSHAVSTPMTEEKKLSLKVKFCYFLIR